MTNIAANVVLDAYELNRRPANFQRFKPASMEEQDNLHNVIKAMQDWYLQTCVSRQYSIPEEMVRVGLLCAVHDSNRRIFEWKRALLTEIGQPSREYKFFLLDYGNYVVESLQYARLLNEDFLYPLPGFLQKCRMQIELPLLVDPVYKKDDIGDENNLPEDVVEKSFTYSDQKLLKMSRESKFVNNWKKVSVIVTAVDSPDSFYVQSLTPHNYEECYNILKNLMSKFYYQYGSNYKIPLKWVTEDFCCVASVNGSVFRVKILNCLNNGIVKVRMVDSGTVSYVQVTDLFLLTNEFAKPPSLAVEARLYGVSPVNSVWSEEDIKVFYNLTNNLTSMVAVFFNAQDQDQLVCDLCDTTNGDKWIREVLIENGNACEADERRLAVDGRINGKM